MFFCPIVPNLWGTIGLSIGHYRTRKKKNYNKQNNKLYSVVCACILQTMKKKQPKSLLQQQITKKCAKNENAKACLCIKIDQDFFENN